MCRQAGQMRRPPTLLPRLCVTQRASSWMANTNRPSCHARRARWPIARREVWRNMSADSSSHCRSLTACPAARLAVCLATVMRRLRCDTNRSLSLCFHGLLGQLSFSASRSLFYQSSSFFVIPCRLQAFRPLHVQLTVPRRACRSAGFATADALALLHFRTRHQ
ncbi:MAG: hypothetical protein FE78DRAFT_238400 [Acidomyces sp. 'richmondensis']|nr:MAG: hypothetical protein FE78DRAFT_238400 [Acidomyces sp. 'richmondensis']